MFKETLREVVEGTEGGLAGLVMDSSGIALETYAKDGSPFDISRVPNIDLLTSTDLGGSWSQANQAAMLTNGQLRLDDPQRSTTRQRFFKAQERP